VWYACLVFFLVRLLRKAKMLAEAASLQHKSSIDPAVVPLLFLTTCWSRLRCASGTALAIDVWRAGTSSALEEGRDLTRTVEELREAVRGSGGSCSLSQEPSWYGLENEEPD
jgi:hypothetical protein